jgi:Tfp pilus assembly protein PilN
MVRINLLPREIVEKRKFENLFVWVLLVGGGVAVLVLAAWLILFVQVQGKKDLLQTQQERAAKALEQAEAYRVFEEREGTLSERLIVAQQALAGRVDWGRITNEISLVLPSDTWFDRLEGDEVNGLDLSGRALDVPLDIPDAGFKTLAKTLARLASLDQIADVWLDDAVRGIDDESKAAFIQFTITADVVQSEPSAADTADSSAPPPPASN